MPRMSPDPFLEAEREAAIRKAALTAVKTELPRGGDTVILYWLDPRDFWFDGGSYSARNIHIKLDLRLGYQSFAQVLNAERQIREALT